MPIPTQKERSFEFNEMFFSSTEPRGIIDDGNSVFQRISGHSFEKLVGAPHNIIRHPDMPKIVFAALWGSIQAEKPICAYVKNMAANGDYYWVLATVFPIKGGYLSVRIKPSGPLFEAVKAVYPLVLAEEKKNGVEASATLLFKLLADAGFQNYESFMTRALVSEITLRQTHLKPSSFYSLTSDDTQFGKRKTHLRNIELSRMFARLETFTKLNQQLAESIQNILTAFGNVHTLSINMSLASRHLGKAANTLAVVSESFQNFSDETHKEVNHFDETLIKTRTTLQEAEFKVSCAYLQNQMMQFFIQELESDPTQLASDRHHKNLELLSNLTDQLIKETVSALKKSHEYLSLLTSSAQATEKAITSLDIVRQTGKVEAAQIPGAFEAIDPYLIELQKITTSLRIALRKITDGLDLTLDEVFIMREEAETLETIQ